MYASVGAQGDSPMTRLDNLAGSAPQTAPSTPPSTKPSPDEGNTRKEKAISRYQDAYRIAQFYVRVGRTITTIGAVLGILIAIIGFASAGSFSGGPYGRQSDVGAWAVLMALLMGGTVWFMFFVAGVIISGRGQQLLASLDSAVHSSPFMDIEEKAQAMSLD
jgi:hypothetical protein